MKRKIFAALIGCCSAATFLHAQAPRIVLDPMGHSAKIQSVNFTPDGTRLVSVSEDKSIRVWNAETGGIVQKFESQLGDGPEGMFYCSAISPDGKLLAVGGYPVGSEESNYIIIIDLQKNQQVSQALGHSNVITTLSFSGDGKFLASGSEDNTVMIWNVDSSPNLGAAQTIQLSGPVSSLAFNPKSNEVAIACGTKEIFVAKAGNTSASPRVLKKHKGAVNKVAYSADGVHMASSSFDNEVILWRADGSVVKEFSDITDPVNALAFSSDGRVLVGLDVHGKGMSWGVPGGNRFTDYLGHDNLVLAASFSPALSPNYVIASAGGLNNEIHLWNPVNGKAIRKMRGRGKAIVDLAFRQGLELFISHDFAAKGGTNYTASFDFGSMTTIRNPGKLVTTSKKPGNFKQVTENIIELPRGKTVTTDPAVDGRILDFEVLPDERVVVGSDFSLKLFDKNGGLIKEFVGHTGAVRAVALSEDGRYVVSGGEDQVINLWRLEDSGYAPSLKQSFEGEDWQEYFATPGIDTLASQKSLTAWKIVAERLKAEKNKAYRQIEDAMKEMGEMVNPFVTLFLAEDGEWVCWTPSGYFNCSSNGSQYFGWHINRGISKLADYYAAEQYFEILYRPTEMVKSIGEAKRVEEIIKRSGERLFDLGRLHRPSVGLFKISPIRDATDPIKYTQGKYVTQARTIPINVEIYDGGGGVKEVNIYLNDKLVINDKEVKTTREGEKVEKTYYLDLASESNEFKLKVINFHKIESKPQTLVIDYTGEIIATSTLHILSVGINKYMNSAYTLNYAQPDAKSFIDEIQKHTKTIFKSVNPIEIYDDNATKANISTALNYIVKQAKPEDVFLFYYAGHGTIDEDHDNEYYLVPTDVTKLYGDSEQLKKKAISATELQSYFTSVKSQKQIILMDACHSGGALKSFSTRAVGEDEKAIRQLARSSGVVIIASSGTKQFATEFDELKHGVFTYALLEAISGKADTGDKKITVNELKLYMEERVPQLTKQHGGKAQYPTGSITGNDFPITIVD